MGFGGAIGAGAGAGASAGVANAEGARGRALGWDGRIGVALAVESGDVAVEDDEAGDGAFVGLGGDGVGD